MTLNELTETERRGFEAIVQGRVELSDFCGAPVVRSGGRETCTTEEDYGYTVSLYEEVRSFEFVQGEYLGSLREEPKPCGVGTRFHGKMHSYRRSFYGVGHVYDVDGGEFVVVRNNFFDNSQRYSDGRLKRGNRDVATHEFVSVSRKGLAEIGSRGI